MVPEDTTKVCRCAIRAADNAEDRRAIENYVRENGITEDVEFAPKDDDEMSTEILSGRFERAVFANLEALLAAIWNGDAEWNRWVSQGIKVELATPPTGSENTWHAFVSTMFESLSRYRHHKRRRQIVASIILSIVALGAMFVLFYLIPPAT